MFECAKPEDLFEFETEGSASRSRDLLDGLRNCFAWVILFGSFQESIKARTAYAKQLGGPNAIAFAGFENPPDVLTPNLFQRKRAPGICRQGAGA